MKVALCWSVLVVGTSLPASAQEKPELPTPLVQLLAEAQANNSQVAAADRAWKAATYAARQVTTLPDPKLTVQQFSVGSPRPLAGYTNSGFAYLGVGASQELPYPGKLRLRGQVAERQTDTQHAEIEVTKKDVAEAVNVTYLQLAYLQQTLGILEQNQAVLRQLAQDALARYQVGQGMQQDVIEAQLEQTKLLREITQHHRERGKLEAQLKGLLHRDQASVDIVAEELQETTLKLTSAELLSLVRARNPEIEAGESSAREQEARLASATRGRKPDFELAYMYENTDRKYRDYYVLTLDLRLTRKRRVDAEIAEAAEMLGQSREALDAQLQQQLAATQQQYVVAVSDAELLTEYRDGLVPQSEAAYKTTLSSYAAGRELLPQVLKSFTALLDLKLEYLKTLADHETAVAHLEALTGGTLR